MSVHKKGLPRMHSKGDNPSILGGSASPHLLFVNLELVSIYHLISLYLNRSFPGLLQGINSPCSFKFSMMGLNPSLTSGFSGYCFLCGNKCGSLILTTTEIASCAQPTDFPSAHTLGLTIFSIKGRGRVGSIFMKTEAWTLLSISLPKRGEGDSGTIRNSCENSTESQLQLKEPLE